MTATRKPQITFIRATLVGRAECLGDGYGGSLPCVALSDRATRQNCKDHAGATGHIVRFVVEDVTVYERDEQ